MENARGKEISLMRTTVKIPGQRPKGSEAPKVIQTNGQNIALTGECNKNMSQRVIFASGCI